MCVFLNGLFRSVSYERLDNTNSAKECAVLVKKEKPSAIGATWYTMDNAMHNCIANFGSSDGIVVSKNYKSCLFAGKCIVSELNV